MIDTSLPQAQTHRNRVLARHTIGFHIANVVHIQHGHGQKATSRGRENNHPGESTCLDEIAADHANPAEEDQDGQIAQSDVAVGHLSGRIGDGRTNCGRAKKNKKHSER